MQMSYMTNIRALKGLLLAQKLLPVPTQIVFNKKLFGSKLEKNNNVF
jgi:hypothetical protein